ncbi:MAG: hypothetical protein M3Y82_09085 [Verrucomicrobiota bacterium]|nr:hypothetical protein [Verrucomicrobiota bacterium]
MKKIVLIALTILGAGIATSKADVAFSISFGHHHHFPQIYAPVPVIVEQPAVIYSRPNVIYAPSYQGGGYHHEMAHEHAEFHHQLEHQHLDYHHEEFHNHQRFHEYAYGY